MTIRLMRILIAALLLGVAPLRVSAQIVQATPVSAMLPKACWPQSLLKGADTAYKRVPCRSLEVLHPTVRAQVECTMARQRKGGWSPLVQETLRSDWLQAWYFGQGRTRPGGRITNAPSVYTTVHGYGFAVDIISAVDGWNNPRFFYWLGQHAEACGMVAGVFWIKFPDGPHIQTGAWAGSPPKWARALLAKDSLNLIWVRVYPKEE